MESVTDSLEIFLRWKIISDNQMGGDNFLMNIKVITCKDVEEIELAVDHFQWRASMLAELNIVILLPEHWLFSNWETDNIP
jgi:hypothetical protein